MYKKFDKERLVFCDVDDTLAIWNPDTYGIVLDPVKRVNVGEDNILFEVTPHEKNIEFLKKLKVQGYGVVIWSAAGAEWAEKIVKKFGLEEIADYVMAKPEVCIDDLLDAKRIIKSVIWICPNTGEFKRNS